MKLCFWKFLCFVLPYFYCARLIGHQRGQISWTRVMAFDVDEFKDGSTLMVSDWTQLGF